MPFGKVYLVGAGPGAVDLLTLRALNAIELADILLYDRLVNARVLDLAPPSAERIYVGKKPGEDSEARQARIHTLMIGHAREGKTVVRLKGGDPFVFGRGGEEALALREAGVDVAVVPGVSSCMAAPAAAMIPVTFRGAAGSFGVFAGHTADGPAGSSIDWTAAARMDTAVFLMGVERLPYIVGQLMAHGRAPDTPIALIERATLPEERVVAGALGDILAKSGDVRPPAVIVVGAVVSLHQTLAKAASLAQGSLAYHCAS